jgi:hypothetical protein
MTDKLEVLPCKNTDREIWRERADDYYADSIHVTKSGGIGINCGGTVYVMPIRAWHALASTAHAPKQEPSVQEKERMRKVGWNDALGAAIDLLQDLAYEHEQLIHAAEKEIIRQAEQQQGKV